MYYNYRKIEIAESKGINGVWAWINKHSSHYSDSRPMLIGNSLINDEKLINDHINDFCDDNFDFNFLKDGFKNADIKDLNTRKIEHKNGMSLKYVSRNII